MQLSMLDEPILPNRFMEIDDTKEVDEMDIVDNDPELDNNFDV